MPLFLSSHQMTQILKEAEKGYPSECCGLGLSRKNSPDQIIEIIPCRNVQDEFNQLDPNSYPRTSLKAYLIDPEILLKVHKRVREEGLLVRLIYHSHIDAPDVFSEEDQKQAVFEESPLYPGTSYLVVSVQDQKAISSSLYQWSPSLRAFCPESLQI